VINYGTEKWENPLSLKDILNIPEENRELWEPWIEDHHIHVINVAEQDEKTRNMYQSDFRHIADYLACRGDKEKLREFRRDETRIIKHPEEFLDMMDAFAGTTTYKAVKKTLEKREGGEQKMCVLYDMVFGEGKEAGYSEGEKSGFSKGKELGLSEGKELGLSEGKETEAIANAKMLFKNGASMELVSASITTISKEKLEEIYEEECKNF
jgi:hypothetical protein